MLMIYVTTGHVPVYWRPPFGDTDTRVSAIAKQVRIISFKHHAYMNYFFFYGQVFFLTTVVWNNE